MVNTVFNGSVTVGGCGEDGAAGDFDAISGALLSHASGRRFKKAGGLIYEPVPGCPCAHRPHATYEAYTFMARFEPDKSVCDAAVPGVPGVPGSIKRGWELAIHNDPPGRTHQPRA